MKKRIISSILLSLSIFCGISMASTISNFVEANETQYIGNIKIKRSSEKYSLTVTKSYFLTADDANTEKKVTYSYPCGAINVNIKNDYNAPLSNYVEGKGLTFSTGSITVKPVSGCTIINFSLNFSTKISWSYSILSNIADVSKCVENGDMYSVTITPKDASKAAEIYHSSSRNGFLGFSVTYSYLHDHNPTWMTEEENHWKECECGLSEYTTEKEPHNFNEEVSYLEPTHTVAGEKVLRCECGKEKSVEVPALGHTQTDIWQSDDFNHWKECECTDPATEFDKAEHKWLFKETVNEPSIEEVGRAVYYCESCGREKEDLSYLNMTDANIKIEAVNSLTYTGKEQIQEVEVYYGDTKLTINKHYTLSNENETDAGDYVLNITGIGTFRGETTFDYSIAKAPLTILVENYEITYGDLAPTYAVSYIGFVNEETETVLEGALSFACEYDQFDDVNEYVITASGLSSKNYEITYIDGKLKVNPKEIGLDWSNLNLIYNGKNQIPTATATGLLNDDECIVEVSGEETNAGTYTANAIALSNSNYQLPNVTTSQYTIEPKAIDGAVVTLKDTLVYTGTELTQDVESVVLDGITLIKDVDYTIKENKGTIVDTYTLTVEGKGNYKGIVTKDFEIIRQKVELPSANTGLIYNGSTQIGVEATELYEVVNGEAKDVGSFTAVATLKDTDNYEWAEDFDGKVAWEITPKEVTVVWENVEDRIYTENELSYPTATIDTYEGIIELVPTIISGGTEFVNVSKYQFKVEFNNDNYTITNDVSEEIEILKATFNMNNAKWDYSNPFTYDGSEKIVSVIGLPEGVIVVSYSGNKATNAYSYKASVVLSYDSENYNEISIDDLEWKINPKEVGLVWGNAEFTYDGNEHLPTVSLTGVVNGDECEFVLTGEQINAGTYSATVTTLSNSNYVLPVDSTKKYTINKAEVTAPTVDTTVFTYNGLEQTYTVTPNALYAVTGTTRTEAGTQQVVVSLVDQDNYKWANGDSKNLTFDFVIKQKELTVTADSKEVVYSSEAPTYTVSYNGFVNNETKDVLSGTLAFTCNYEQYDDVGNYEINASGYTSNNYEITYVDGNLEVTQKEVGLTWGETTFTYNGEEQVPTVVATGLVNNDTCTVIVSGEKVNAGTYTATAASLSNSNYKLPTNVTTEYTIEKAQLTVTVDDKEVVYGSEGPTYTVSFEGFVNGESENDLVNDEFLISCNYEQYDEVGNYVITAFGYATHNYELTYVDGNLEVTQKEVGLTWGETTFTYNGEEQVPTVVVTGLVNNDICTVTISGEKVNAGTYTAEVTEISNSNYKLPTNVTTEYKIEKAQLTVTADSKEVVYGSEAPTYTVSYNGFVNGETKDVLGGTLAFTCNYEQYDDVGNYDIIASGYTSNNYKINYVDGNLEVTQKEVGLTWGETIFTYNGGEQVPTVVATGLVNNDTCSVTVSGEKVNAGTYTATAASLSNSNYKLPTNVTTEYKIEKAQLTITVDDKEVVYGSDVPTYTVSYNGFVNNETKDVLSGTLAFTCNYEQYDDVGNYDIIASGYTSNNYKINYVDGNLEVTKKEVGLTWGETTFTYNGEEQVPTVVATGLVNNDTCTVIVSGEKVNAGTYTATAASLSNSNYKLPTNVTTEYTINKQTVAAPEVATSFVYNGAAHSVLNSTSLYTVSGETKTNVGTYIVTLTLLDSSNYKWVDSFGGEIEWTITKATYDMSGISFDSKTVVANGENKALTITGALPSGVTVTYSVTECVEPGVYEITATFSGDYANYNEIASMKATLTIKQSELKFESNLGEGHEEDVFVTSPEGIDPAKELTVELIEIVKNEKDYSEYLKKNQLAAIAYDVKLLDKYENSVQPESVLVIKILIPVELREVEFGIMHVHSSDDADMIEFTRDGDYVIIETKELSEFVFVYETGSILWVVIVLGVIALLEGGVLYHLLSKKKQMKTNKLLVAYPPFIFGMFIPAWEVIVTIILVVAVVTLAIIDVLVALSLIKTNENKQEVNKEIEKVESTSTEEVDDEGDEIKVWDEETQSYTVTRIIKSLEARLSQSSNETKCYYDNIKNELLSYKKVKSKISFKHEVFKIGKDTVAKLKFRGKTLCLYLALNPNNYVGTKYKIEDMSDVSSSENVPTMYRINLPRRVNYAKELIADVMSKFSAVKSETKFIEFSQEYPYMNNESLLEKGLLKQSTKVVTEDNSSVTLIRSVKEPQ